MVTLVQAYVSGTPYSYKTKIMRRQKEAADIYSVLKPVFFTSKILGLFPYNVVGDTSRSKVRVSALAVVYGVGMFVLIACVLGHGQFKNAYVWGNICNSGENIMFLGTSCSLVMVYSTLLLSSRKIARLFDHLNGLVWETPYSAWKKDLRIMLSAEFLVAIMLVIAGVLEFSVIVKEYEHILSMTYYCVAEFVCFVSENQFVVMIIVLKRIIQNWNSHICDVSQKENTANLPRSTEYANEEGSNLFSFSNKSTISNRASVNSMVSHFRYIRKQHASACEFAVSVNSVYSAMLLFSVARAFMSLTQTLYYILMDFVVQKRSFSCETRENNSYYIWLLYYAVRLTWLLYATNFTAKEVSHEIDYFDVPYLKRVRNM
jgi:hypothetical protein